MTFENSIKKCPLCRDLMYLEPLNYNLAGLQPLNRGAIRSKQKAYFCCRCNFAETAGKTINVLLLKKRSGHYERKKSNSRF